MDYPFRDPSLPLDERLDDLIGRLTIEEKTSQLSMTSKPIERLGIVGYDWWNEGVPVYGELLMQSGERRISPHWGEARSTCVWGLTMPNFAPLADWDAVLAATMNAICEKPDMHFINGVAGAMAAVDPWDYPEEKLIELHRRAVNRLKRPVRRLHVENPRKTHDRLLHPFRGAGIKNHSPLTRVAFKQTFRVRTNGVKI